MPFCKYNSLAYIQTRYKMKSSHRFIALLSIPALAVLASGLFPPAALQDTPAAERARVEAMHTGPADYGTTPQMPSDLNPQVKSVAEAIRDGKHPERLSTLLYSKQPFDLATYRRAPAAYLDICEPGRAFQPAQPGPGVQRIAPVHPPFKTVAQGASVTLSAKGLPHSPVTFTSTDLGIFANQLTSITADTGEDGIATVRMLGTPGTIADVHVIVASPVTSGQLRMIVHVTAPTGI